MARELAMFKNKKLKKHPSVTVTLRAIALDNGYMKDRVVPKDSEFTFTGKVLNRNNEGYRLPYWVVEAEEGGFAKALKKAVPSEKETVSSAPASGDGNAAPVIPADLAPAAVNAGDLV